jgi:hypothetical protein
MHIIARLTPEQTIARAALHPPARSPP